MNEIYNIENFNMKKSKKIIHLFVNLANLKGIREALFSHIYMRRNRIPAFACWRKFVIVRRNFRFSVFAGLAYESIEAWIFTRRAIIIAYNARASHAKRIVSTSRDVCAIRVYKHFISGETLNI